MTYSSNSSLHSPLQPLPQLSYYHLLTHPPLFNPGPWHKPFHDKLPYRHTRASTHVRPSLPMQIRSPTILDREVFFQSFALFLVFVLQRFPSKSIQSVPHSPTRIRRIYKNCPLDTPPLPPFTTCPPRPHTSFPRWSGPTAYFLLNITTSSVPMNYHNLWPPIPLH